MEENPPSTPRSLIDASRAMLARWRVWRAGKGNYSHLFLSRQMEVNISQDAFFETHSASTQSPLHKSIKG